MTKVRKYLVTMLAIVLGGFSAHAEALDRSKFTCMVQFTASGYDGESTLENFPALVRLSEGIPGFHYSDIGDTTNAVYASLRFADADYNNLDYEIETWDTNGTSFVWVSIPELSGTGTKFFACYMPDGGYTLPDVYPTNVWTSAGYVGVWHLNDIIKNNSGGYKEYNNPLWGHVFPDSTGRGANATKGTTHWNTSLINVPNDNSGYHFPESLGRANGTLGANAYTPFIIPPTAEGGGAGEWKFSGTGYSTEAWIFPFGKDHAFFIAGQNADTSSANFTRVSTNLVHIAASDWGGSGVGWNGDETGERIWHFVTTVWTPTSSVDPTRLYGTSEDGAPALLQKRDCHATDQFATEGMRFTAGTGLEHGVDEMRVRRGLSTPDWIQANWDTQRVGTDFLSVSSAFDPREPSVTDISENSATVSCAYSFTEIGDSAKAIFVNFATKTPTEFDVSDLVHPSVTATGLVPDTDYDVRFVVKNGADIVLETPIVSFTTGGRPVLKPDDYKYSITFTASGYDGSETLEYFPALVHLSETTVPGFSYHGVDPSKIRFTSSDGSLIPHEVETWDPTGLSTIWVGLPTLSGTDTSFTMYWKPHDSVGVTAQPIHRVWKYAGYLGVWHLSASVKVNDRLCYKDSSGGGADLFGSWKFSSRADSSCNANGTPWSADGARAVTTNTAGWTFSRTGYSVESWISTRERPGYNKEGNAKNGYMFASEANTNNCAEKQWAPSNGLQVYPTYATIIGGLTNTTVVTSNPVWHGDATNDWHFISAVWKPEGSTEPATLYEAGVGYSSHGTNLRILRTVDRRAIDFDGDRGMGVFASSDRQGNGCWYDEARVRRGISSKDWIQANWDTQRVGTDFLTAGEVKCRKAGLIIFVR